MGNDARNARKGKEDEGVGSKKNASIGKNDSSGSGSVSGETSALRRSTRNQNGSSPSSVRKSQRLGKETPPKTPSSAKNNAAPVASSLRRSERENKFQLGSSGKGSPSLTSKGLDKRLLKSPERSNNKDNAEKKEKTLIEIHAEEKSGKKDTTLKRIIEEASKKEPRDLNHRVGEKRKKRLDARQFKAMFMKPKSGGSGPLSKKRRLNFSSDNAINDPGERHQENGNEDADSGLGSFKESSEDTSKECTDSSFRNLEESLQQEKCHANADSDLEEPNKEQEPQECGDGGKMENNDVRNGGVGADCVDSMVHKNLLIGKSGELEDGEGQQVSWNSSTLPSALGALAASNLLNTKVAEVNELLKEKLPNQEGSLASGKELDGDADSRCSQKGSTPGASTVDGEGITTTSDNAALMTSTSETSVLAKECAKCSKKQRLVNHSPEQELCCCLQNSLNDDNTLSVCKVRGESWAAIDGAGQLSRKGPPVNANMDSCVICKHSGKLLYCGGKGCLRGYHLSCLWGCKEMVQLPVWYCSACVQKKLTLGVHSVSKGIDSIWDVREVETFNSEGAQKGKQYFVKYKGLAHIHNRWVSETQLLHEAPELLLKLNEQDPIWNPEWALPHRLLLKRPLSVDDGSAVFAANSQYEWLVKWHGLDYDQATWELDGYEWFKKPEAQQLLQDYISRQNMTTSTQISEDNEIQERSKSSHVKHGRPSDNPINKLREYHRKRHNGMLFDEQERAVMMINFISSLLNYVSKPFLVITSLASLSYWEAEFLRLGASINVVLYGGSTDARKLIRSLEFYREDRLVMLQVLLSSAEAISEDLDELKGMVWEAVIVDDCQDSCILANSRCIKSLATDWRLLLLNAQLKDYVAEYIKILSLLERGSTSTQYLEHMDDSNGDINLLKERLSSFVIFPCYHEYWVPVEISNFQLEQYCFTLHSNITALCSCTKSDPVGSLENVLICLRKCCDHPYIVNPSLRMLLPEGHSEDAALNMGVPASGKLQLLDSLLSEFRNQHLKVLIYFQSIGSGKDVENILQDFLAWRFGEDSYEYVASGGLPSKRHATLHRFNTERNRSFLLLEARAYLPSIKLSSVDAVIIVNSDWNPLNDVKALQKITIDSKLKQIRIFRMYCSYTVEEKALILSRNDVILDSSLSPCNKQMLLMWGSSYLFSRLNEFHHDEVDKYFGSSGARSSILSDVRQEIFSLVWNHGSDTTFKYVSVARQDGRHYLKSTPLLGEQRTEIEDGVASSTFWSNLLEGKQPQWKYQSGSSERNRKRVHYCDEPSSPSIVQTDEVAKKLRTKEHQEKSGTEEMTVSESGARNSRDSNKHSSSTFLNSICGIRASSDKKIVELDHRKTLQEQRFGILKPTLLRLCENLLLKDDEKILAERFLEYVLNNEVTPESEASLQALQIAVCWTAAMILDNNIDKRNSLVIAREKMGFSCQEQEAEYKYSKLRLTMKIFWNRCGKNLISSMNSASTTTGTVMGSKQKCVELAVGSPKKLNAEFFNKDSARQMNNKEKDWLGDTEKNKKKCDKQMERFKDKQNEELENFEIFWRDKLGELEKKHELESAVIRYSHANSSVGVDKLKILDSDFAKKKEELKSHIARCRKELEARQKVERDEEQKKIVRLLELVKSMAQPLSESSSQFQTDECIKSFNDSNRANEEASGTFRSAELPKKTVTSQPCEVSFQVSDKQKGDCENDTSTDMSGNVSTSQGGSDGSSAGAGPVSGSSRLEHALEEHSAPGEMAKDTNQVDAVMVDRLTASVSNHDSSSTLISHVSTVTLLPPVCISTEQKITDETTSQGIGNEQRQIDGAVEGVQCATGIPDTSIGRETSALNHAELLPSDLASNEVMSLIPATMQSLSESVTHTCGYDQSRGSLTGQLVNQPSEVLTAVQSISTQRHMEQNSGNSSGETSSQRELGVDCAVFPNISQGGTSASVARVAFTSHPSTVTVPTPTYSRVSPSYHSDPLQNEYERIRKEIGDVINTHEEMKLHLKSECDREIEELIAQVRRKYNSKLEEAESLFSLKRNELEMNQNMVLMNKFLADAFRSKCLDYKAGPGMQQGVPRVMFSSLAELLPQIQSTARPSSAAASISVVPTASLHSAVTPVRGVHPSPSPTSGLPSRAAQMPSVAQTGRNQQIGHDTHEIRAAAAHSQLRSAPSMMSSSSMHSSNVLTLQASNSRPASSSLPQISGMSQQPPLFAPLAFTNSSEFLLQSEMMRGAPPLNSSMSATELLNDITRRNQANICRLSNNLPPLPDNVPNFEFVRPANAQPPQSVAGGDIVCLSDGDD